MNTPISLSNSNLDITTQQGLQSKKTVILVVVVVLAALGAVLSVLSLLASVGVNVHAFNVLSALTIYGSVALACVTFVSFAIGISWLVVYRTRIENQSNTLIQSSENTETLVQDAIPPQNQTVMLSNHTQIENIDRGSNTLTFDDELNEIRTLISKIKNVEDLERELDKWIKQSKETNKVNYNHIKINIIKCYKERDVVLDIQQFVTDYAVLDLPEVIGCLSNLKVISIYNYKKLTYLPKSLCLLKNLEKLGCMACSLDSIPTWIDRLQSLKELSFNHNHLTSVPDEVFKLNKLKKLYLNINQILSLPNNIPKLASLKKISMQDNCLELLPESFENLNNLKHLNLSHNRLVGLPNTIINLDSLKELDLEGNQLRSLPDRIGTMKELDILNVSLNHLTSLPDSLFREPTFVEGYDIHTNTHYRETHIRRINLNIEGNPFATNVLERIQERARQNEYRGARIAFSMHSNSKLRNRKLTVDEYLSELYQLAGIQKIKLEHFNEDDKKNLELWLDRLSEVSEFRSQSEASKKMAVSICNAIGLAEADEEYRQIFIIRIQGALETCGDRVALSILQLDLDLQITKAKESKDYVKLAYLLWRGTYALERLDFYAEKKVRASFAVDHLEVYLGYPIMLKKELDIPIVNESMLFFHISGLTKEEIQQTGKEMRDLLSSAKDFVEYIVKNDEWINALKTSLEVAPEVLTETEKQVYKMLVELQTKKDKDLDEDDDFSQAETIEKEYRKGLEEPVRLIMKGKMPITFTN